MSNNHKMIKCDVCKVNFDVKYKCPSCLVKYCSKQCYEKHSNDCQCSLDTKSSKSLSTRPEEAPVPQTSRFTSCNLVPLEKLEALRNDKSLLELLDNKHLRNLLKTINDSENPEEMMHKAMQEPLFTEFADACLNNLEPPSESEG